MADEQHELDEILASADSDAEALITAYEPLEAQYRQAFGTDEVFPAASNTTMMPRAIVAASATTR